MLTLGSLSVGVAWSAVRICPYFAISSCSLTLGSVQLDASLVLSTFEIRCRLDAVFFCLAGYVTASVSIFDLVFFPVTLGADMVSPSVV